MEKQKGHVSNLLEDSWFFGNNLLSNKPRSSMMLMSYSNVSNSLNTHKDTNYEHEEEGEEEEARIGDLIREAMPMSSSHGRLDRMTSLPSFRGAEDFNMERDVGRLSRRASIDSSVLLSKKDDIEMVESGKGLASTMLCPPKYATAQGRKPDTNNTKNRAHKKTELTMKKSPLTTQTSIPNLEKIKAQKSLSSVEIEEFKGFNDLFEPNKNGPKVTLQRKWSLDSNFDNHRPKSKHDEDMKDQIKLWARNVASNARHIASNN